MVWIVKQNPRTSLDFLSLVDAVFIKGQFIFIFFTIYFFSFPNFALSLSASSPKSLMVKKTYTRPGVEAAARLVSQTEEASSETIQFTILPMWERLESQYSEMLMKKGGSPLVTLDRGCVDLGKKLQTKSSSTLSITKDEMLHVVQWKFAKGKPRHALMKHLNSNTESDVLSCSQSAFAHVEQIVKTDADDINDYVKQSLESFCELKGIGPATASAILGLYCPQHFAFMDDEVIECLYDKKRGYTLKIYMHVNQRCEMLSTMLGGIENGWTPYRVGKILWTASRICATGGEDITLIDNNSKSMKKKETDTEKNIQKNENEDKKNDGGKRQITKASSSTSKKTRSSKRIKTK